jgi:hypothetical protein
MKLKVTLEIDLETTEHSFVLLNDKTKEKVSKDKDEWKRLITKDFLEKELPILKEVRKDTGYKMKFNSISITEKKD